LEAYRSTVGTGVYGIIVKEAIEECKLRDGESLCRSCSRPKDRRAETLV
jgi:hypothetical protein